MIQGRVCLNGKHSKTIALNVVIATWFIIENYKTTFCSLNQFAISV